MCSFGFLKYFKKVAVETLEGSCRDPIIGLEGHLKANYWPRYLLLLLSILTGRCAESPLLRKEGAKGNTTRSPKLKDKVTIARHVSEHGIAKAVRCFEDKGVGTENTSLARLRELSLLAAMRYTTIIMPHPHK